MPTFMPKPFEKLSHCSLFCETFVLGDNGRYGVDAAKNNNTYIEDLEKTVADACVIKYVGKNGVKVPDDKAFLKTCGENAVRFAQDWVEASGKDHVVFVLEGDNIEETTPFILAQLAHIKELKEGNKYKVKVLIVKGVQEDGYSKAFVEPWQRELSDLSESYFAVVGTTKAEESQKADLTYSLAGLVINIGSSYKHEGFMYKLNKEGKYDLGKEGNKVKTTGYRELCELRDSPNVEEVLRLDGKPVPAGLNIFKRAGSGEGAAVVTTAAASAEVLGSVRSTPSGLASM